MTGQNLLKIIIKHLSQIADILLLNGTLTYSPGLVHGKMGIAVFFFHYAKYTGNILFSDYAIDLIREMQNQLHTNTPADYENGIAGIGVGIDYLNRNEFLIIEDGIYEDFDAKMYRAVMYDPWLDFSLYDGLTGYGRYWISRLNYQMSLIKAQECVFRIIRLIEENFLDISIKEQTDVYCFLLDLNQISGFEICSGLLDQCRQWDLLFIDKSRHFPRLINSSIGDIIQMCQQSRYFNESLQNEIDIALKQILYLDIDKLPSSMGLLTGYAGEGMLRLTALNQIDIQWANLL